MNFQSLRFRQTLLVSALVLGSLLLGSLRTGLHRKAAGPPSIISFPNGVDELTRAMADELGDRLRLRSAIRSIERRDGAYELQVENGAGPLRANAVALAVPAHRGATSR